MDLQGPFEARNNYGQRKGAIFVRVLKMFQCVTKRRAGGDEDCCHAVEKILGEEEEEAASTARPTQTL